MCPEAGWRIEENAGDTRQQVLPSEKVADRMRGDVATFGNGEACSRATSNRTAVGLKGVSCAFASNPYAGACSGVNGLAW